MAMGFNPYTPYPNAVPGSTASMMGQMPSMPYLPNYGQMQPQQPQVSPQQNVNWIYVNGIQGAREHIVQPGQTAWLMDNNDPIIYVKAVDAVGTSSLRAFQLVEVAPEQPAQTPAQPVEQYATREEVAAISKRLDQVISEIGGLNT